MLTKFLKKKEKGKKREQFPMLFCDLKIFFLGQQNMQQAFPDTFHFFFFMVGPILKVQGPDLCLVKHKMHVLM